MGVVIPISTRKSIGDGRSLHRVSHRYLDVDNIGAFLVFGHNERLELLNDRQVLFVAADVIQ